MNLQFNKIRLYFVLLLIVLLNAACATSTKTFQPGVIPEAREISKQKSKQTEQYLKQYVEKEDLELVQSGPMYERVRKLVNEIEVVVGLQPGEIPVYIALDDGSNIKNAFAMNSTAIVVFEALLNSFEDDDKLMVVISHEVAHILADHASDNTQKKRSTIVRVLATAVDVGVSVATDSNVLGSLVGQGANTVGHGTFVLSYSRAQEYEADHIGMLLMAKAGYDPKNALYVWQNASKYLGASNSFSFLSSHPSHSNRQEQLSESLIFSEPFYEESQNTDAAYKEEIAKQSGPDGT